MIQDFSTLDAEGVANLANEMLLRGTPIVLEGSQVATCGGTGQIHVRGQLPLIRGMSIATITSTYSGVCVHGCKACPHHVTGVFTQGDPLTLCNHVPVLTFGQIGVHAACCGPNTATAIEALTMQVDAADVFVMPGVGGN